MPRPDLRVHAPAGTDERVLGGFRAAGATVLTGAEVDADVELVAAADALSAAGSRSWVLPTALPPDRALRAGDVAEDALAGIGAARWVLCRDEAGRALLESAVPDAARRTAVLDPADPDPTLHRLVERTFPTHPALAGRTQPLKVVVAGHDLGFIAGIVEYLRSLREVEVRIDHVAVFARHDEAASQSHVDWADVVVCEWLSPVAAWYSRRRRPGQRLVVRLHRMELYNDWTEQVDIDGIDQVVCVSPHYRYLTLQRTGWPEHKVVCIPNYVDCDLFDRPKLLGAERNLGFIGVVPSRKRLDLALDVLETLRADDPRWTLFVKTKMWWDYPWSWRNPEERAHAEEVLARIQTSPLLADAVVFDEHGADVAAWMRKIGYVLSTSDDESFHLAPAEGMAGGALPVVRAWPGAETIYDTRWLHEDAGAMAAWIAATAADGTWASRSDFARAQVRASIDVRRVCEQFVEVLLGDLPGDVAGSTLARRPEAVPD